MKPALWRLLIDNFAKNEDMEAPKLPSVFKAHRAKQFEFKPRYYDERKERLEELKKKYDGKEVRRTTLSFREKVDGKWRHERSRSVSKSNLRLLLIIAILTFITYKIIMY